MFDDFVARPDRSGAWRSCAPGRDLSGLRCVRRVSAHGDDWQVHAAPVRQARVVTGDVDTQYAWQEVPRNIAPIDELEVRAGILDLALVLDQHRRVIRAIVDNQQATGVGAAKRHIHDACTIRVLHAADGRAVANPEAAR